MRWKKEEQWEKKSKYMAESRKVNLLNQTIIVNIIRIISKFWIYSLQDGT